MKRKIIIALFTISCMTLSAQETAPTSASRVGQGKVLSLQQLKDSALNNNIAIRTARFDMEAARHQRQEAFTKYFPNISGTGLWFNANKGMAQMDVNPSEFIPSSLAAMLSQQLPPEVLSSMASPTSISMMKNGTIGSLMAMQPIFAGGQIINGNKLARLGEDVSRLQLRRSENEVEKTTEQYYWQLVTLQEKMKTIKAVETFLSDIYKDVDVAVRAGVALPNDRLQVQLRQNDVASQKLKLQNGIFLMKQLLRQYASLGSDFEIAAPSMESQELPIGKDESGVRLVPEYQLLDKQVEATGLQHKIAIGQQLPSVAVGAGYNYHNLLDKDRTFGMIFATVSIPISDWWGGSHSIKRKKIEHQKAKEQLEDTEQLLLIRMQNAWNSVQETYQQLQLAQKGIEQAEENLRLNRNYYQAGTSRMSDLLEAQLLYQQACDKRTDTFAEYQNKRLEYRQAVGQ